MLKTFHEITDEIKGIYLNYITARKNTGNLKENVQLFTCRMLPLAIHYQNQLKN